MIDFCYSLLECVKDIDLKRGGGSLIYYRAVKLLLWLMYPVYAHFAPRTSVDPNADFIVSLTSFPARIGKAHLVIETLLRQRCRPRKIILWLAEEQFPEKRLPKRLTNLTKFGLEIRWCEDLRLRKKYYYTMLNYPELTVITVDDDTFYPESLTKTLVEASKNNPNSIVCLSADRILYAEDGLPLPCSEWESDDNLPVNEPRFDLMGVGVHGILYPPHALAEDVFDKEFFMDACPNADDLWLKTMSLKAEVPVVKAARRALYADLSTSKREALYKTNGGKGGGNDRQLANIIVRYGDAWKKKTCLTTVNG